ncbi:MAG: sigma-70 family RNA polymerase sigma factor [Pseudomonadota bacterium]
MVMPAGLESRATGERLADPRLRREVEAAVKRRVSSADADDVVQAALADILSAPRVPEDTEEFRRFVFAVTRNKVFDHFRRRVREVPEEQAHEPAAPEPPLAARDILRWAEDKLPSAEDQHTLEWMLREGDGEKLEHIARDVNLPAPRVRQRVSRLRRFLRERWAAELMLGLFGLALITPVGVWYYRHLQHQEGIANHEPVLRPEPPQTPEMQGRELRRLALERCQNGGPQECLNGLNQARALDAAGNRAAEVVNARNLAAARLASPRSSASSAAPSPPASDSASPQPLRREPPRPSKTPSPFGTESGAIPAPPSTSLGSLGSIDNDELPGTGVARPHKATHVPARHFDSK